MERVLNIATVPMGQWGAGFSQIEARAGHNVRGYLRHEADFQTFLASHTYPNKFPDVVFSDNITPTNSIKETLEGADIVVLAPPSRVLRDFYRQIRDYIPPNAKIISLTKGLERGSNQTMSQVLEEEEPGISDRLLVLSGPNFADEAVLGLPMATTLASRNFSLAQELQGELSTPTFRIYTNGDVKGVELNAAIKNVDALAAGIGDGLKMGKSARAALIDRALFENRRFVEYFGGEPETAIGLSGVGDLVLTCTSKLSRNHEAGKELAKGLTTPKDLLNNPKKTVEGVYTVKAVVDLAREHGIEMPIAEAVYAVFYEVVSIKNAYLALMARPLVHENGLVGV
ncbi:MAG: NAD(P)H-dependent glycerol-3-phosphate dehydrogenase [Patescibacteria group bacterium]